MKLRFLVLSLLIFASARAQKPVVQTQPFFVRMDNFTGDNITERIRYFQLQIPKSFVYDTTMTWANDPLAQVFAIDYLPDLEPDHLKKGLVHGKQIDLKTYASLLTARELAGGDSAEITNLKTDKAVKRVNGFSTLKLTYHLHEMIDTFVVDHDCIGYLVPVMPKGQTGLQVVLLRFSAKPGLNGKFPDHNPDLILQTIKPY